MYKLIFCDKNEKLVKKVDKLFKEFKENKVYVDQFLSDYTYNFVKKLWVKKDFPVNIQARLKGEM